MMRFNSCVAAACLAVVWSAAPLGAGPVQVKIVDEKATTEEGVLPLDPVKHVTLQTTAGLGVMVRVENKTLHLGQIQSLFKIDGQVVYPNRVLKQPMPLGKGPSGKMRDGMAQFFEQGPIHVTQTAEVVPSKPARAQADSKRRLDTVLVRYTIENKDTRPHDVGTRVYMNMMLVTSRTPLFAAPNQPGKLLNGVELKDAAVPDYLQVLQNADLQNPGYIAYLTCRFNRKWEAPNRLVLTRLGAGGDGFNMMALPAGNSALAVFWDPAEIKPGAKRELAYAYGGGIATPHDGDSHVSLALGGSFEPGKVFTITAHVDDPGPGQSLTLELPEGMQRVEGKERQPVPLAAQDDPSVVVWKARVLRTGQFRVRVRSSAGVTLTKLISIRRAEPDTK